MSKYPPKKIDKLIGDQIAICINIAPAMQRLSDCLKNGYTHAAECQPVPHERVGKLLEKWLSQYQMLGKSKHAGTRARKAGQARYKLVVFWNKNQGHALMYLLTDRPELDEYRENWRSVSGPKAERLRLYQYEAVRITRAGQEDPSWTWQIERKYFGRLKMLVTKLARRGLLSRLASVEAMAHTWPGFNRVRRQHSLLGKLIVDEWPKNGVGRPRWRGLRYVQRMKTRRDKGFDE